MNTEYLFDFGPIVSTDDRAQAMRTNQNSGPGRPTLESEPAQGWIQTRVTMERKNAYVHAAQKEGLGLTRWIFKILDQAAHFEPTPTYFQKVRGGDEYAMPGDWERAERDEFIALCPSKAPLRWERRTDLTVGIIVIPPHDWRADIKLKPE